jgi:hypothetical protein
MADSPAPDASGASEIREVILSTVEASLQAQLTAIRRLRSGKSSAESPSPPGQRRRSRKGRSQIDLAYDILAETRSPLHISVLLERIEATFGQKIDSESLVSALSKRVARKDRFLRTEPNTFTLRHP